MKTPKKHNKTHKQMHDQYLSCISLVTKMFPHNDWDKAVRWMKQENELCFGRAPLEIIFSGEGDQILAYLEERSGKR